MKYFKNTELAKLYNVSEKSVRNWIQAAVDGKLDLQLYEENGRPFIANTSKNTLALEVLAEKGKKFRNRRGFKNVTPQPKFYKVYSTQQVFDIIANLDIHREIPYEYSYFSEGAKRWDSYTRKMLSDHTSNTITNTINLIETNYDHIDSLIEDYDKVNVIDVGVGNSLPVRPLLERLLNKGNLKRYIALDISEDMLKIAKQNVNKWFGDRLTFEGYVKDINYDRFNDLIIEDSFNANGRPSTINIVLFLGGTISNLREPNHALSTIHESMGKNDILLFTKKLDTSSSRRYFDFTVEPGKASFDFQTFRGKTIIDLLNISEDLYEVEQLFDEKKMTREVRVKIKIALSLVFESDGKKRVVDLNKGETILLWRATHQNTLQIIEQFDLNDFELLQASKNKMQDYMMLTSKIRLSD